MAPMGMAAEVSTSTEATSGLVSWVWRDESATITLNQLLPDQVRAFFQGRGFSAEQSERVARHCVFQMIVRNEAQATTPMDIALDEWRVISADTTIGIPRTASDWDQEWGRLSVGQGPRIAFRWALFPASQQFQPGDWNMGMLTLAVPAGATFDLQAVWHSGAELQDATIDDLRCAEDR